MVNSKQPDADAAGGARRRSAIASLSLEAEPTQGRDELASPPPQVWKAPRSRKHNYTFHDMPDFLQFNPHVLGGYRRWPMTFWEAAVSVCELHNETLNCWTHLLGLLVSLYFVYTDVIVARAHHDGLHHGVIVLADVANAVCFMTSLAYHGWMAAAPDARRYEALMGVDVWGIFFVMAGASSVLTYLLFPCGTIWTQAVLIGVPVVGCLVWLLFIAEDMETRAKAFGICWMARVTIISATALFNSAHWPWHWLAVHLLAEFGGALGAFINVRQWPERWRPGGVWDYFNSHTIMHILAGSAMLLQHVIAKRRAGFLDAHPEASACLAADLAYARGLFSDLASALLPVGAS